MWPPRVSVGELSRNGQGKTPRTPKRQVHPGALLPMLCLAGPLGSTARGACWGLPKTPGPGVTRALGGLPLGQPRGETPALKFAHPAMQHLGNSQIASHIICINQLY